jgi:hypothetical protein
MATNVAHYFFVNASDTVKYVSMKREARATHEANATGCLLSVVENDAGTEALVKVWAPTTYNPSWARAPFLIQKNVTDRRTGRNSRTTVNDRSHGVGWTEGGTNAKVTER